MTAASEPTVQERDSTDARGSEDAVHDGTALHRLKRRVLEMAHGDPVVDRFLMYAAYDVGPKFRSDADYAPPYTRSLDAALVLVQATLPDWRVSSLVDMMAGRWRCELMQMHNRPDNIRFPTVTGEHRTPALATVVAVLEALIAKDDETPSYGRENQGTRVGGPNQQQERTKR